MRVVKCRPCFREVKSCFVSTLVAVGRGVFGCTRRGVGIGTGTAAAAVPRSHATRARRACVGGHVFGGVAGLRVPGAGAAV